MPIYTLSSSSSSASPHSSSRSGPFGFIANGIRTVVLLALVLIVGTVLIGVVAVLVLVAAVILLPVWVLRSALGGSRGARNLGGSAQNGPVDEVRQNVRVRQVENDANKV